MSNKDPFDTTYRKTPGAYITGKDADADTYNTVHVDANGHLFAKMVGDAGATNVALACDSDGRLSIKADSLPLPSGASTSANQGKWNSATSGLVTWKDVDGKPRVSAMPYLYDIAEGNVTGHTPWSKIGYNPTVATNEEDLWSAGGVYVFPTSATLQMEVVSSLSTADVDVGTILFTGTSDVGGSDTTMLDAGVNFAATAAIGDVIIIDKSGTTPEWGVLTAVANGSVTFAGKLSSGGSCLTARTYQILDTDAAKGAMAVKIDYLTSAYVAKTEIVILATNTPVPLISADTFRVNSFRVIYF